MTKLALVVDVGATPTPVYSIDISAGGGGSVVVSNTIPVIGGPTPTADATIPVAVSPSGAYGAVAAQDSTPQNILYVLRSSDLAVAWSVNIPGASGLGPSYPVGIAWSPDNSKIAVSFRTTTGFDVCIVDVATQMVTHSSVLPTVASLPRTVAVVFSPDSSKLFVSDQVHGQLNVLDTTTWAPVGASPFSVGTASSNCTTKLKADPGGSTIWMAEVHSATTVKLWPFDIATLTAGSAIDLTAQFSSAAHIDIPVDGLDIDSAGTIYVSAQDTAGVTVYVRTVKVTTPFGTPGITSASTSPVQVPGSTNIANGVVLAGDGLNLWLFASLTSPYDADDLDTTAMTWNPDSGTGTSNLNTGACFGINPPPPPATGLGDWAVNDYAQWDWGPTPNP